MSSRQGELKKLHMADNESQVPQNAFYRVREHLRHGAQRIAHFRRPVEDPVTAAGGPPPRIAEETPVESGVSNNMNNLEDFPYDSSRDDPFISELAAGSYDDDGHASPRSQISTTSMDTLHSSVSGSSWTSTQKNIGGVGTKERRSQDVLGPYKRNGDERNLGGVSADFEDYDTKTSRPAHPDTTHPTGNTSFERSSSTSSDRSVPDSLYADLSSVSDRDLQVPEGLVKAEGMENGYDNEGRSSPSHASHVKDHLSNLKLHASS